MPNLLFVLSQCRLVGVKTPLVPFPTITLFTVKDVVLVPPFATAKVPPNVTAPLVAVLGVNPVVPALKVVTAVPPPATLQTFVERL